MATNIELLDQHIGKQSQFYEDHANLENMEKFCSALGIKLDRENASVLPTYLTRCRKGEFELFQGLGVDLSEILHTDQEYEYYQDIPVGSFLQYNTEFTNVTHKNSASGGLHFLTFESRIAVKDNPMAAALARTVVVLRQ